VGVALHLVVGPFGHFERYELYIWTASILTAVILLRSPIRRLASTPLPVVLVGLSTLTVALGLPYIWTTAKSSLGSNNIFEQQYQMHRFATQFYQGPVAVEDLGWVSFRNDEYVLDLWGLANRRAARARVAGRPGFRTELAQEHGVELAMLYTAWYPDPPDGWTAVAELALGKRKITPAEDPVTFFVLQESAIPRVRRLLHEFGNTLPPGVALRMLE
jgi:hypothetical protein